MFMPAEGEDVDYVWSDLQMMLQKMHQARVYT